jgi:UPF0755 protein
VPFLSRGNRSRPAGERTAEERERAREERERARANRSPGGQASGPSDEAPVEERGLAYDLPLQPHGPIDGVSEAPGAEHDPVPEVPAVEQPPPVQEPVESTPAQPEIPAAVEPPEPSTATHEAAAAAEPEAPAAAPVPAEEPVEPTEPSTATHEAAAAVEPEAPPAAVEIPPTAPEPPPPTEPPEPIGDAPEQPVEPPAPRAVGVSTPADIPLAASAISSARFDARTGIVRRARRRRSPPARLGAVLALVAAIAAVVLLVRALHGSKHPKVAAAPAAVRILVAEGKTRMQVAELAHIAGLTGSYRAAAKRSPRLNPVHYGAPRGTPDLEGFLFPATYEIAPRAPASRLVDEQLTAFVENFDAGETARARALHITPYQLLTVASMIEREAQVPADRSKIAAVIYNRLHQGMPLGIDATIYYAVELRTGIATYTKELTEAQLHINSPYNTRTHKGLPPTPISNPGLASIRAAANPVHASYLYYVAAADGCGEQRFSSTLAKFEANAAAYNAAVAKNHGHPPVCKKK